MANSELMKKDTSYVLARHFVQAKYSDIPSEVVEIVKKSVLDTPAVSVEASTLAPAGNKLAEIAREAGGKEESSLLIFGGRVPAFMACACFGSVPALFRGGQKGFVGYDGEGSRTEWPTLELDLG